MNKAPVKAGKKFIVSAEPELPAAAAWLGARDAYAKPVDDRCTVIAPRQDASIAQSDRLPVRFGSAPTDIELQEKRAGHRCLTSRMFGRTLLCAKQTRHTDDFICQLGFA